MKCGNLKISNFHFLNFDSLFEGGTVMLENYLLQFSGLLQLIILISHFYLNL